MILAIIISFLVGVFAGMFILALVTANEKDSERE